MSVKEQSMENSKRELKFRAWDKLNKKWFDKGLVYPAICLGGGIIAYKNDERVYDTEHIELMQYTGLKDKNGKEIYEKDSREEYSFIDFCNDCFGYQEFYSYEGKNICHNCDGDYDIRDIDFSKEVIIGNIFSNPELIK